jgi:hypothetical protein
MRKRAAAKRLQAMGRLSLARVQMAKLQRKVAAVRLVQQAWRSYRSSFLPIGRCSCRILCPGSGRDGGRQLFSQYCAIVLCDAVSAGTAAQHQFLALEGLIQLLSRALAKTPKHQKGNLYRGTNLPRDDTRFVVGGEFQGSAFLSTSKSRQRAFDKPYLFIIDKSYTGVDIMKQSVKRSEQEVLFPPGKLFDHVRQDRDA